MKTSEKRLVGATAGSIALLVGAGLWWSHWNADFVAERPAVQMPEPNAFDFYVKAGQTLATIKAATPNNSVVDPHTDRSFNSKWTPQEIARRYPTAGKVKWLKKCAPVLSTVRQGLAHEYREPPRTDQAFGLKYSRQLRDLARLLSIESHARAEQGDLAGASQSALDILKMGHSLPRGAPMVGALIGYAIDAIGLRELRTLLPKLDASTARAAVARIEQLESKRINYAESLEEEKWLSLHLLQQEMKTRGWRMGVPTLRSKNVTAGQVFGLIFQGKRSITRDHARFFDALIATARKPYKAWQTSHLPAGPANGFLLPVYEGSRWNAARDETNTLIVMLQLALHAYRLEHRRLPDALKELTPAYIKKVPHDPFGGGEELRYRRTGETYVLYSIGPDGKDDGGRAIDRPQKNKAGPLDRYRLRDDSIGDIVAGINR